MVCLRDGYDVWAAFCFIGGEVVVCWGFLSG